MIEACIRELDALKRHIATGAMTPKSDASMFDYGKAVGLFQGVDRAIATIRKIHADEKDNDE